MEGSGPPDPPPPERRVRPSLAGRIVSAGARTGARGAQRVAETTGIDQELELAVERAVIRALDSDLTDRIWERLLDSDEVQKLIERIANAPEIRAAIAHQGMGLIEDVGEEVGEAAHAVDGVLERVVRRVFRRPARVGESENAGLVSRAAALLLDAGILNAGFFLVTALIGFVVSAISAGEDELGGAALVVGTGAWLAAIAGYLVFFWSLSGQTPGMRFLGLRLRDRSGAYHLGLRRSLRRLGAAVLGAIPFGAGYVPILFNDRRRGFHDRVAETEMFYEARVRC